jgi:thermitase
MLLTTVPLGIVGKEAVNEEQSLVEESFNLENDYFNRHIVKNGDSIEYKSDDDSVTLPRFVPGELIVKFKDNVQIESPVSNNGVLGSSVSSKESANIGMGVDNTIGGMLTTGIESIDQLNNQYSVISIEELFPDTTISSLSNIYKFTFPVDSEIIQITNDYNSDDNVVYAEPNYLFTASLAKSPIPVKIPNDPLFNQQWALNQTGDCDIDAPEAWNIKTGDSSVVIAIVDTGVDYNHPDLAANIWHDPINGNPGYDFVDINTTEYTNYGFVLCPDEDYTVPDADPMDVYSHGTHCAGIASAVTNNSVGVAGVSWNCKIMPVRNGFKIDDGFGDIYGMMENDDSANAIIYAADNGADVISMSWGGMYKSQLIKDALDYAYGKGVVLVAAAGNDNFELKSYPSGYDNVIAVGATDENDKRAYFSTYGDWIDVAAPGVDILSTTPGNQYVEYSGTSMATPLVAGVAGLLISKNQQCPYPAYLAKSMIPFTSDKIQTDHYIGKGRVNAYKALVQKPFAAVLDSIDNWEDVKGTIDINGAAWGENFQYFVLEDGLGENPSSWTTLKTSYTSQGGVLLSLNTKLLAEGLHTIRLKAVYSYKTFTDEILMYVNNQADGSYSANIFVSNCFDSSTSGWGVTKFDSIQDGIDYARKGNTIFVYDGVYLENINISGLSKSSISLIGQNKNWTIIDGGVGISLATKVTVTGFCIRGAIFIKTLPFYSFGNLILIGCSNCKISQNNIIMDEPWSWYQGITLYVSTNNIISENTIKGFSVPSYHWYGVMSFGIDMFCCLSNTISDNIINNFQKNIFIGLSSKNNILDNNIEGGDWGITGAIITDNVIKNNHIIVNIGVPLDIIDLKRNKIMKNTIIVKDGSIHVMWLVNAEYNKIIANHIESEYLGACWVGLRLGEPYANNSCFHNKIYYNNFINCYGKDHGGKDSTNIWYKEKLFGYDKGNYWSIYPDWHRDWYGSEPKDSNHGLNQNIQGSDGIWDDPMIIMREQWVTPDPNWDKYPVVDPFDIDNIEVSSEMSEYITVEESELLVQLEETINSQILSGELNTNDIMNSYISILSETSSQSQQTSQQSSQQDELLNKILEQS